MTKKLTLAVLTAFFALAALPAVAQYSAFLGARLLVDEPATLATGMTIPFSPSNDGTGAAGEWGQAITMPYSHRLLVPVAPQDGCGTVSNVSAFNGGNKWALVKRGNCSFSEKAAAAQAAGAEGVVVYDSVANGPLINMGSTAGFATVTIPVIFVSNANGAAWIQSIAEGDPVYISLTPWGFEFSNDLALVPSSQAEYHARALPLSQMVDGQGDPAYMDYFGVFVANTGLDDQPEVTVAHRVSFTPSGGGSSSTIIDDTVLFTGIPVIDSVGVDIFIDDPVTNNVSEVPVSQTGKLTFEYAAVLPSDEFPSDNSLMWDVQVTDSVFSKGRWDAVNGVPIGSGGTRVVTDSIEDYNYTFMTGPVFYVAKGGHAARKVQFRLSNYSGTALGDPLNVGVHLFKYTADPTEPLIYTNQLSLVGSGTYNFAGEASGGTYVANINATGGGDLLLDDNSYYWVALEADTTFYILQDAEVSYYTRGVASENTFNKPDPWVFQYFGGMNLDGNSVVSQFPFYSAYVDSASRLGFIGTKGSTPAMALHLSKSPLGVNDVVKGNISLNLFPNPASTSMTFRANGFVKDQSTAHYTIMDAMGRVIRKERLTYSNNSDVTISTSGLPSGNYWFVLAQGTETTSKQFVINQH